MVEGSQGWQGWRRSRMWRLSERSERSTWKTWKTRPTWTTRTQRHSRNRWRDWTSRISRESSLSSSSDSILFLYCFLTSSGSMVFNLAAELCIHSLIHFFKINNDKTHCRYNRDTRMTFDLYVIIFTLRSYIPDGVQKWRKLSIVSQSVQSAVMSGSKNRETTLKRWNSLKQRKTLPSMPSSA